MMDKKKAADLLDNLIGMVEDSHGADYDTALRMGIEALNGDNQGTDDLISRKSAIAEFSCCELTPDGGIDANYAIDFLKQLPSAHPNLQPTCNQLATDTISRQAAIDAIRTKYCPSDFMDDGVIDAFAEIIQELPSAQPERLTDDDFETIRIHLNAYKEKLCNQQRWKEAEEYQRIIDRFMAFASAQPERKKGKWVGIKEYCDYLNEEAEREGKGNRYIPSGKSIHVYCNQCWEPNYIRKTYCPNCGARMAQEGEEP